jgi:hypothetical protein
MQIPYSQLTIRNPMTAEIVNAAWRRAPEMCRTCPELAVDIEHYSEEGVSAFAVCGYTGETCDLGADECTRGLKHE